MHTKQCSQYFWKESVQFHLQMYDVKRVYLLIAQMQTTFFFLFSVSINATESAQCCWQVSWEHDKHSEMLRSASGSFSVRAKHLIIKHRAVHYRTLNCLTSPVGSLGTDAAAQLYQDKTSSVLIYSYTKYFSYSWSWSENCSDHIILPLFHGSMHECGNTRGWHDCINLWIP